MFNKLTLVAAIIAPTIALIYCANVVEAQRFAPGYCPTIVAQENFDKTKFFGNWIEVEKTPSIFDLMMRCLVVDYSDDQDNTVNVVVRGISLAGLPLTVNGDGLLQDVHRSGFYSIRYGFGVPFQGTLTTILDTDYDDYAVVYSCTNSLLSGVFHSEYIWVLSRSGKISNPTRQNIYEKLDKLQINRSGLTMSDRSTCPTNSSTVARESDKDLAGQQQVLGANAQSTITNSPPDSGNAAAVPASSSSSDNEQAKLEPPQKSVVVPLLYDTPAQQSAGSQKPSVLKSAPVASSSAEQGKPAVSTHVTATKPSSQAAAAQSPTQAKPAVASPQQSPVASHQAPVVKPVAPVAPVTAAQTAPVVQSLPRASRR